MVGRKTEYDTLTEFITSKEKGVRILGINGPGGVGKTYLLDMVLNSNPPEKNSTIVFRLDNSKDVGNYDFIGLFNTLISSINLPETIPNRHDIANKTKTYLSKTQKAIGEYYKIVDRVSKEIDSKDYTEETKIVMKRLLYVSKEVINHLPTTSLYPLLIQGVVNSDLLTDKFLDEVFSLASGLKSLQVSSGLLGFLPPIFSDSKVKTNLFGVLSESMYLDLQKLHASHPKLSPCLYDKVLIIIDDFEIIGKVFGDFLTGTFIRTFLQIPYSVGFIILGRDNLEAMHPSFTQHLGNELEAEILLECFSEEETLLLLTQKGFSKPESEQIYKDTYGYPYLVSSIIEGKEGYPRQLQLFYKRITRWMSKTEKEWFSKICYLDVINNDTLKTIFHGYTEEKIEEIRQWFEGESAIRDPHSKGGLRIIPFIRRKVLELFLMQLGPITYNTKVKEINKKIDDLKKQVEAI